MARIRAALIAAILLFSTGSFAEDRTHLPRIFHHSYLGLQLGFMSVNFQNSQLRPGFSTSKILDTSSFYHFYIGHYFNPYIALEAGGYWMNPGVSFLNINNNISVNSIKVTAIGLFAKPTWPVSHTFSIYALLGGGYVSRPGFYFQNLAIIQQATIPDVFFGTGFTIMASKMWGIDLSILYAVPNPSHRMPNFVNLGLGAHFNFASAEE